MAEKTYDVAVVGATGAVGETMIEILAERDFPVGRLYPLASANSAGSKIEFKGSYLTVGDLAQFDFSIPLVVPEVNPHAIEQYARRNIIANPNCSTIQMVVALKPIYDAVGITRINVATYQAVSGTGKLATQTANLLNGKPIEPKVYPKQIAFNCLPHIDVFMDNGYTREEMKMVWETKKILEDEPVFYGHAEAVHIETRDKITTLMARDLLENAPGVVVLDTREPGGYPTQVTEAAGHDPVYVGRIREDLSHNRGLDLWVVADNVRKGAALNSVQIAEILVERYLK